MIIYVIGALIGGLIFGVIIGIFLASWLQASARADDWNEGYMSGLKAAVQPREWRAIDDHALDAIRFAEGRG